MGVNLDSKMNVISPLPYKFRKHLRLSHYCQGKVLEDVGAVFIKFIYSCDVSLERNVS